MVIDLICENNSNKLCDPSKNQISMQSLLVLGSASGKTEIVFDVVDISFDNSPDFIGIIPFFGATDRSGISTKILFWVDVDHPPTFRRGTRVVTGTMTMGFLSWIKINHFHFWTDKFISCYSTAKFGSAFVFHL